MSSRFITIHTIEFSMFDCTEWKETDVSIKALSHESLIESLEYELKKQYSDENDIQKQLEILIPLIQVEVMSFPIIEHNYR